MRRVIVLSRNFMIVGFCVHGGNHGELDKSCPTLERMFLRNIGGQPYTSAYVALEIPGSSSQSLAIFASTAGADDATAQEADCRRFSELSQTG